VASNEGKAEAAEEQPASRTARRVRKRRLRRTWLIAGVGVVIVGSVAAALALSGGESTPRARATIATTTTTSSTPGVVRPTIVTTNVARLDVYAQPATGAPKVATLPATTSYRTPTTMLVDASQPLHPDGWLPVTVPLHKPNDTAGWVKAGDVTTSQTPYAIHVSLLTHTLVLLKDGQTVLSTQVIIGAPTSVTPTGRFYVTDPVNCNKLSVPGYPVGRCSGAYGVFAIGTSALSEQLDSFQGTIPQIALHGTDLPASELGKDLSNGCVRMANDVILQIARITPLIGTPVTISQ